MKRFDYYQPQTLKEAFALMEKLRDNAKYIAGGTDLIVRIKQRVIQPEALISLRAIESLRGIKHNEGLSLGSMTLMRDVERDPAIARDYAALAQAVWVLANPQIRNMATVGGNLGNAAPSADCAPPLMVMEAQMVIEGPGGRREVPIESFFKGPGQSCMDPVEVLTEIKIPRKRQGTGMAFLKTGRVSQDISVANAAALLVMEKNVCRKCRLAVGAVAPIPLRLGEIEKVVEGKEINPNLLKQVEEIVQKEVKPITDVRSTEAYRRTISGVLVRRAIERSIKNLS